MKKFHLLYINCLLKLFYLLFSDEKFRRVFKEIFLVREMMKECYEELKVTVLQQGNVNITDKNEPTFLSKFNFPLQSVEELEEVEQYLQDRNHFQSTVRSLYFSLLLICFYVSIVNFYYIN